MTSGVAGLTPGRFAHRHRHTIGFVAASIIWAAVIIDTGDIAWPLTMWMATALGPLSVHRHRAHADR